jgi:RimJ/RimL family protein N-acetyltransferase
MIALTGIPVIETERLRLRGPRVEDFEVFAGFLQSERAAFVGGTQPRVQAWRAFGHLTGHWVLRGFSMFIIADKATDAALGMSGPWYPEGWPEPEIGWSIWAAEAEGKGVAFEAATAARAWAYEALGWTSAISLIVDGNDRSEALARRMGCVLEGAFIHEVYGKSRIFRHPARTA